MMKEVFKFSFYIAFFSIIASGLMVLCLELLGFGIVIFIPTLILIIHSYYLIIYFRIKPRKLEQGFSINFFSSIFIFAMYFLVFLLKRYQEFFKKDFWKELDIFNHLIDSILIVNTFTGILWVIIFMILSRRPHYPENEANA